MSRFTFPRFAHVEPATQQRMQLVDLFEEYQERLTLMQRLASMDGYMVTSSVTAFLKQIDEIVEEARTSLQSYEDEYGRPDVDEAECELLKAT